MRAYLAVLLDAAVEPVTCIRWRNVGCDDCRLPGPQPDPFARRAPALHRVPCPGQGVTTTDMLGVRPALDDLHRAMRPPLSESHHHTQGRSLQ